MDHLKAKVDAGADYLVTQLFFDNRDFYDFRERCELAGIKIPILAGIMPISSEKGMRRMADLAAGCRFPAGLLRSIQRCGGDEEAVKRVGVHWATEQCRDLLDHRVRGLHFYTLNQSDATRQIFELIRARDKTGTFSLPWIFERTGQPEPQVGDRLILIDMHGTPTLLVRLTRVYATSFGRVTAADAPVDGSPVRDLAVWVPLHTRYWNDLLRRFGLEVTDDMPFWVEQFELLYDAG
jgi:uncharacterized protein YhfF